MTRPEVIRFADAMAVMPLGQGVFAADLSAHWAPKPHGGMMLALLAGVVSQTLGPAAGEPVAVSANCLSTPEPDDLEVRTTVHKRGRQVWLVAAELVHDGRVVVRAAVRLGTPGHQLVALLTVLPKALTSLPLEPSDALFALVCGDVVAPSTCPHTWSSTRPARWWPSRSRWRCSRSDAVSPPCRRPAFPVRRGSSARSAAAAGRSAARTRGRKRAPAAVRESSTCVVAHQKS